MNVYNGIFGIKNLNFEVGQRVLEFGQHDGKMYYKIQKDI